MRPYYERGDLRIYLGDCRDLIPEVLTPDSVGVMITDPPYGQAFNSKANKDANVRGDGARQGMRIYRQMLLEMVPMLRQAGAHLYTCCHWEGYPDFYDALAVAAVPTSLLIWHKDRGGMGDTESEYARDYEMVIYAMIGRRPLNGRRDGSVIRNIAPVGQNRVHPTEKPVALMRYLLQKSAGPGLVVDPFMGSGPVLRAAADLGVPAVGIEIEEQYCEAAARRLDQLELMPGMGAIGAADAAAEKYAG